MEFKFQKLCKKNVIKIACVQIKANENTTVNLNFSKYLKVSKLAIFITDTFF